MTEPTKTPKRIWRIVLVASLALNLIVIGIGIGAMTKFGRPPEGPPAAANGSVYLRALSHESRRNLGRDMRDLRKQHGEKHGRNRENHYGYDSAIAVLTTTPFDAEKLATIMEEQAQVSSEHLAQAREMLLVHLSKMNDAERQEYAAQIVKILKRRQP